MALARKTRKAHRWSRFSVRLISDAMDEEDGGEEGIGIAAEYLGVDRILQRWAVSVNGGVACEVWEEQLVAKPPPLDEESAYWVDRAVCSLRKREQRLIHHWYRKNIGIVQIKKRLHIRSSADLKGELSDCLKLVATRLRMRSSKAILEMLGEST